MKKILSILACVALSAMMLVGCGDKETSKNGGDKTDGKVKVGFSIKNEQGPYFVSLIRSIKKLSQENGWECTVLNSNDDTQKESENIDSFIAQGMKAIFLDSIDPESCVPSINKAAEAGIPVINLDSASGESNYCTTVYSDNKQNGRLVGIAYAAALKKDGKEDLQINSVLLSGTKGNVAGQERRMGLFAGIVEGRTGCTEEEAWTASQDIEDQLKSKGKAENKDAKFLVSGQGWGGWNREKGLVAAEDLITANKELNCIMGENDQMLFGALTALDNAGIKGVSIVAAADGAKEAYDLIKAGEDNPYVASGENSPFKIAELGIKIAKEIIVDGKDWKSYDKVTMTDAVAVSIDNVDERYEFGF